ncbi:MAG: acyltransferase family protein, partial [Syntrophobacteraceae bacterium]
MRISADISERIRIIRFPLILGVIFIHNYGYPGVAGHGAGAAPPIPASALFIENLFSNGFARIAVPLFYIMSGYLFFNDFNGFPGKYVGRFKRRASSLLVPFLLWNVGLLILYIILQSFQSTRIFLALQTKPLINYSVYEYIRAIFGIVRDPISYQFWFIRDLMILVLLSPVIHYMATRLRNGTLCICIILWLLNTDTLINNEALLFFFLGSYLAINKNDIKYLDGRYFILTITFILLTVADAIGKTIGYADKTLIIHKMMEIAGVASVWTLTKVLLETKTSRLLTYLSNYAFFVFACHEPLLRILRKLVFR